ncbi:MAG: hypothetical protein NTZ42_03110 [Candidatus Gribaldobacteria bacterium]|nr:hypothetical protein [Candidatus Gribaldobacteria bacterium]
MPTTTDTKTKKDTYFKCPQCGNEIFWNTRKQMVFCQCGALGVDGCEYYVRLVGDGKDRKEVIKIAKTPKNPTPKISKRV